MHGIIDSETRNNLFLDCLRAPMTLARNCVDKVIDNFVFYPPCKENKVFNKLTSDNSKLVFVTSKNKKRVSLVEIYPSHGKHGKHGNHGNHGNPPEKYLVYSHGTKTTIVGKFNYWKKIANDLNIGIISYDYIGYGLSENEDPSEQGCYDSLDAVMDYINNTLAVDKTNIILVGRSLGTGIVVDYAVKHNWETPIMLISPYKSICTVVMDTWLVSLINKYNTVEKISRLKCPTKIIHGTLDDIIDISHAEALISELQNKDLPPLWIPNIGHRNIFKMITYDIYLELINYNNKLINSNNKN